jgi:predicted nucleic acid-binding protein
LVIYVAEKIASWRDALEQAMAEESNAQFAISPLVAMECLVGPLRSGDTALEADFKNAFLSFTPLQIDETVFFAAAAIRARFGLKTPDAIHLACAQHHKCSAFWTADQRFRSAGAGFVKVLAV